MKKLQRSPITFTSCLMLLTLAATAQPTTAPAPDTASNPSVSPTPGPALGDELRGKVKEDGKQFADKSAAAKLAFEARQAAERESLATSSKDKGFWESRRLKQELLATQEKQRREFRAEQARQRRMHEWSNP